LGTKGREKRGGESLRETGEEQATLARFPKPGKRKKKKKIQENRGETGGGGRVTYWRHAVDFHARTTKRGQEEKIDRLKKEDKGA